MDRPSRRNFCWTHGADLRSLESNAHADREMPSTSKDPRTPRQIPGKRRGQKIDWKAVPHVFEPGTRTAGFNDRLPRFFFVLFFVPLLPVWSQCLLDGGRSFGRMQPVFFQQIVDKKPGMTVWPFLCGPSRMGRDNKKTVPYGFPGI